MREKIGREVALLCLPLAIVGVAVFREKLIPPSWRQNWEVARHGKIVVLEQQAFLVAPADDRAGAKANLRPFVLLDVNSPWIKNSKGTSLQLLSPQFRDSRGRSWPATLTSDCGKNPCGGRLLYTLGGTQGKSSISHEKFVDYRKLDCRLPQLPADSGDVWYEARLKAGDTRAVPIKSLVRPAWLVRPAKQLQLVSVSSSKGDDCIAVKVILKRLSGGKIRLNSNWDKGSIILDGFPPAGEVVTAAPFPPTLFSHWNERLVATSIKSRPVLSRFKPVAENPDQMGDKVVVTYSLLDLPDPAGDLELDADIFLEGDGYIRVQYPLSASLLHSLQSK